MINRIFLGHHESSVWNLLDSPFHDKNSPNPSPPNFITSPLLRLIRYFNDERKNPDCHLNHHVDIGLISFIPISTISGLQGTKEILLFLISIVMRKSDGKWIDIERNSVDSSCHLVVIGSEILQYITSKAYRATVHRVVCSKPGRLSLPFLTIPRMNAVITQL